MNSVAERRTSRLFIVGCHRSYTSYIAGALASFLDLKETLWIPANIDNPSGFYETESHNELNDVLLDIHGYTWDYPPLQVLNWVSGAGGNALSCDSNSYRAIVDSLPLVSKDPRTSLLLDAYRRILLCQPKCLISVRNPHSVAVSLETRNRFALDKCYLIWFLYNYHIARSVKGDGDEHVINSCSLVSDPNTLSDKSISFIQESLNIGDHKVGPSGLIESFNTFRDQSLVSGTLVDQVDSNISRICGTAWNILIQGEFSISAFSEAFANIPQPLVELYYQSYKGQIDDVFRRSEIEQQRKDKQIISLQSTLDLKTNDQNQKQLVIDDLQSQLRDAEDYIDDIQEVCSRARAQVSHLTDLLMKEQSWHKKSKRIIVYMEDKIEDLKESNENAMSALDESFRHIENLDSAISDLRGSYLQVTGYLDQLIALALILVHKNIVKSRASIKYEDEGLKSSMVRVASKIAKMFNRQLTQKDR